MLDFQNLVVAREISHERVHGLSASPHAFPGMTSVHGNLRNGWRKLASFLAQPVNMVFGQRVQNRHRSLEGTT